MRALLSTKTRASPYLSSVYPLCQCKTIGSFIFFKHKLRALNNSNFSNKTGWWLPPPAPLSEGESPRDSP